MDGSARHHLHLRPQDWPQWKERQRHPKSERDKNGVPDLSGHLGNRVGSADEEGEGVEIGIVAVASGEREVRAAVRAEVGVVRLREVARVRLLVQGLRKV